MRQPAQTIQRKQFVFMDGGTTNLVAARIIPERFSTTVATQYPAIAGSLSAILDLEPEAGADDDYAEVVALRKSGGLVRHRGTERMEKHFRSGWTGHPSRWPIR